MTPDFDHDIIRTLLYYEIFDHPLTLRELFQFFPRNSISFGSFRNRVTELAAAGTVREEGGFYQLAANQTSLEEIRVRRERLAKRRLRISRFMSQIIKRFPFVRGVFLSGDLSKGVASPPSDIDYVVITEPGRLWVCRSLLILFKKVFLLNRKKYFCLNYFVTSDHLGVDERNYYTATEVAHLKPLYNFPLLLKYMNENTWIKEYFPNFRLFETVTGPGQQRRPWLQRIIEMPLQGTLIDNLDKRLMKTMASVWRKRYGNLDELTRERIFRSTPHESRAFAGNFSTKIDTIYKNKLLSHGIPGNPIPERQMGSGIS